MLDEPLRDLPAWTNYFATAELPVLRRTAFALAELRDNAENASTRDIARALLADPLATARALAFLGSRRSARQTSDVTTLARTILMVGIDPFFKTFETLPIAESASASEPHLLRGLMHVVRRAQRAADYAYDWALRRQDLDVEEIATSALLHDLAEILLWCFAPRLASRIEERMIREPGLRSRKAQHDVLGIELVDLQLELARTWHLPDLLVKLMDDHHPNDPRVRNVVLAVNLARHSAAGWDNPALPDDYRAIGDLLRMDPQQVQALVGPAACAA